MEIKEMEMAALEARKAEIAGLIDSDDADLDALEAEVREINAEIEKRKAEAAKKEELRKAVAKGMGEVIDEKKEERKKMPDIELRNTKAYIDAYAEYIKTGDDKEVRALLTENGTGGTVPVPELVEEEIRVAWDNDAFMSRVRKAYVQGNFKVGFEISATDASVHAEGAAAPAEETLLLGVVEMIPQNIKKWITVSDEVLDLKGEAFLRYVYREIAHKIAQAAAKVLIDKIIACGTQSTSTCVGVPVIKATTISLGLVAQGLGELSDQAANACIIMNKKTWAAFKAAQYAASYAVDPFEGLPIVYNNNLPAFSAASSNATYAIIGDLDYGALANLPNGDEIVFKFDDLSLSEQDLVKIVGREYAAIEPVAPNAFVKITK